MKLILAYQNYYVQNMAAPKIRELTVVAEQQQQRQSHRIWVRASGEFN